VRMGLDPLLGFRLREVPHLAPLISLDVIGILPEWESSRMDQLALVRVGGVGHVHEIIAVPDFGVVGLSGVWSVEDIVSHARSDWSLVIIFSWHIWLIKRLCLKHLTSKLCLGMHLSW